MTIVFYYFSHQFVPLALFFLALVHPMISYHATEMTPRSPEILIGLTKLERLQAEN